MERAATTSEVADALGVSPSTVQNYSRRGLIPFETTPGGHRRFDLDEVLRAVEDHEELTARTTPRTTTGSAPANLVDATDLQLWADRRSARSDLHDLVRRLLLSSGIRFFRFQIRTGEGVDLSGWDAIVEAEDGNAWVPTGTSFWELGTSRDPVRKAADDCAARSEDPLGEDPTTATFVFVTPRRFADKEGWARERRLNGPWRDVRVLDADDLAAWLLVSPATHVWLSHRLGRDPFDAEELGTFWHRWAGATEPPIPAALMLAGREDAQQRLLEELDGEPSAVGLRADSREEALAFLAAALRTLGDDDDSPDQKQVIVVSGRSFWSMLLPATQPLVLAPTFPEPDVPAALRRSHHVVIPLGRQETPGGIVIDVPRVRRDPAKEALERAGVDHDGLNDLATLARRSLLVLRRHLAHDPALSTPPWAELPEARALVPAFLAGMWDGSSPGDQEILASLADGPYEDLERTLTRLANSSDPPLRRTGATWLLVSKEDAWRLLAPHLTAHDLERFKGACRDALGEIDPAAELPADERWSAALSGHVRSVSQRLAEGLADTLVFLSTRSDAIPVRDLSPERIAPRLVRELLQRCRADASGVRWTSLAPFLPQLAEAAPDAFLSELNEDLTSASPTVMRLFTDSPDSHPLLGSSAHPHLLWALERLAWSPDHLGLATHALARLARLDAPDARLANRPAESLRAILLTWFPHTAADLEERLEVIDGLRERVPDVAWQLLLDILPGGHCVVSSTAAPRWRDWKPEDHGPVTYRELNTGVGSVVGRILEDVGTDGQRWAKLLKMELTRIPADLRDRMVDRLAELTIEDLDGVGREMLTASLRQTVVHHRRYPDASWTLPTDIVDRLAEILDRLEDTSAPASRAWLFQGWPELPSRARDRHAFWAEVQERRQSAVDTVHASAGLDGIIELAREAEIASHVGYTLGRAETLDAEEERRLLGAEDVPDGLLLGYVDARFQDGGWDWVASAIEAQVTQRPPERTALLMSGLPANRETWDRLARLDEEIADPYWSRFEPYRLREEDDHFAATRALLEHGRPYRAVLTLDLAVQDHRADPSPDLCLEALDAAPSIEPDDAEDMSRFARAVATVLDYLDAHENVNDAQVAGAEWPYVVLLGRWVRPPKALHRLLAQDPSFFAQIASFAYRGEYDEEQSESRSDEERIRARLAWELLHFWKRVPGTRPDGTISAARLTDWVTTVREELAATGRSDIGDQLIGKALRYAPNDEDSQWPPLPVRDLIEDLASEHLERGIEIEVYNSRGVTTRGLTEGGRQERELAAKYRAWATDVRGRWPRTANMLRRIASGWEQDAEREDREAELREDTW